MNSKIHVKTTFYMGVNLDTPAKSPFCLGVNLAGHMAGGALLRRV